MSEKKIQKKPVIIYVVPPKVIHAEAGEFMALVQRLTGKSPSSSSSPSSDVSLQKSSCKDSGSTKASRRQFPVRVKARLAASRQPSYSETQYSPSSYLSREFFSSQSCSSGDHDVVPVASQGDWLLDGGQSHNQSDYSSVGSHNFIDIFQ